MVKLVFMSPLARLVGVLLLAAGGLAAVMFGLAGELTGRVPLPDAARGSTVETLPEAGRGYTIEQVAALPKERWTPLMGGYIRAGKNEPVWIRVVLANPKDEAQAGVLGESGYYTDVVDFWQREAGAPDNWRHERSGEWIRDKPIWGRSAVFPVSVPARASAIVYFRVEDASSVWLDLAWWPDREKYAEARLRIALAEGVYYGSLFALFFYNAVLWVRLRFADTGYYLGYLGSAGLFFFTLNGGFPQFITPVGSPVLDVIGKIALGISAVCVVQFGRVFLELAAHAPRADRLARWLRNGLMFVLVMAVAMPSPAVIPLLIALDLAVHGTMLAMALTAWRAGVRHARYFCVAFGCLFAGLAPVVWLLASDHPQHWGMMAFFSGSVMEMLLLSLALADRFARIQRERAVTQERLVEEMTQRETLQEAYADELKFEVDERTHELQEANRDKDRMIAVIGHDLRAPLTALTMGAEQASGRAGEALMFVDEAAQTGRQVLLLIEDLVLWARVRAGGVHRGEHLVSAVMQQVVALHEPLAAQRGVALALDVPAGVRVKTDFVLAQTLLRNLVANAVRFAHSRVTVTAVAGGEGVQFSVEDDGPGLPAETSAALDSGLEAAPLAREGGLGLRLCGEIGHALGLRLKVQTGAKAGTRFSFILPEVGSSAPASGEEVTP